MEFVRTVMSSDSLAGIIDIPEQLRHRLVEILILPCEEKVEIAVVEPTKKARGLLSKYKNVQLIEEETIAFEKAMVSKHEDN